MCFGYIYTSLSSLIFLHVNQFCIYSFKIVFIYFTSWPQFLLLFPPASPSPYLTIDAGCPSVGCIYGLLLMVDE